MTATKSKHSLILNASPSVVHIPANSRRHTSSLRCAYRAITPRHTYDDADNMVRNSGLCAANPNMLYPAAGAPRPHAPTSICGTAITYDANGNTETYDLDGAGPKQPRAFTYDLENRPIVITRGGIPAIMAYGPDTERVSKSTDGSTTHYFGNDAELTIDALYPAGQSTSYLHPDVRRQGLSTDLLTTSQLDIGSREHRVL